VLLLFAFFFVPLSADFGAEVIRVDRKDEPHFATTVFGRGKKSIKLNLKKEQGKAAFIKLVSTADVLLEGFRPGVMERLGLGPQEMQMVNEKLIYARLTGWGQEGAYAKQAGHDINYIAISGALSMFARPGQKPLPPVNLLGDFAGGSLFCTIGVLMSLFERSRVGGSQQGQVVDAAMLDGTTFLTTFIHQLGAMGMWQPQAGANLLDTGAPFYDTYACRDGKFVAVGALEPQFYAELLRILDLVDEPCLQKQVLLDSQHCYAQYHTLTIHTLYTHYTLD
jgi:alpha-methylacyl-CoA racemase